MISDFLSRLGVVATSTIALAGYVVVVVAWTVSAWVRLQPLSNAARILGQFRSDNARTEALGKLLGNDVPQGLRKKDLMSWETQRIRHRSRVLALVAYLSTLITAVVIFGMAAFQPAAHEVRKPPVLVDSEVTRGPPRGDPRKD